MTEHYDIRREGLTWVVYILGTFTRPLASFDTRKAAVAYVRKIETNAGANT